MAKRLRYASLLRKPRQNIYPTGRLGDQPDLRCTPRRGDRCSLFFTTKAFLIAMCLWWVAGSLGIGIGYHRLLTHRSFKTSKWVEYCLTICATLALEGGPIFWVATHRKHHQNTDKEGDPHSPNDGAIWSHIGWLVTGQTMHNDSANLLPLVPDLRKIGSMCGSADGTGFRW